MTLNFDATAQRKTEDPLFSERLDMFLEKSLNDIQDFAQREGRNFEQVRSQVAEWHCRYLFDQERTVKSSVTDPKGKVHEILETTSKVLESLLEVAGRHSLLLVVDPADEKDNGFLGGTITGREFWRGMRNGGAPGARYFKQHCKKHLSPGASSEISTLDGHVSTVTGTKQTPAVAMKNKLYVEMRSALRAACGIRNAEMKWSKPGKLSVYGVAIVGWPKEIDFKNPSRMSFQETSTIARLLKENVIRFCSLQEHLGVRTLHATDEDMMSVRPSASVDTDADLSWACNEDDLIDHIPANTLPLSHTPATNT